MPASPATRSTFGLPDAAAERLARRAASSASRPTSTELATAAPTPRVSLGCGDRATSLTGRRRGGSVVPRGRGRTTAAGLHPIGELHRRGDFDGTDGGG